MGDLHPWSMSERIALSTNSLEQLVGFDHRLSCSFSAAVSSDALIGLLVQASRFGDWGLSFTVGMVLILVRGWTAVAVYAFGTAGGLILQKSLKNFCGRLRPCQQPKGPPQRAPIPDQGSFPSGHTLHAVMGAWVISMTVVVLAPVFIILAVLIAVSRVVLGLHYPSDVAAGAALGLILGQLVVSVM